MADFDLPGDPVVDSAVLAPLPDEEIEDGPVPALEDPVEVPNTPPFVDTEEPG